MKKLFGRRLTGKFIGIIVGFIFIFSIGFLAGMNKTTIKPAGNKLTDTKSTEKLLLKIVLLQIKQKITLVNLQLNNQKKIR